MDVFRLIDAIQKVIRNRKQSVREILESNGVQSMEQYQKLMGEMDALFYVEQELTSLIQKQEHIDECSRNSYTRWRIRQHANH